MNRRDFLSKASVAVAIPSALVATVAAKPEEKPAESTIYEVNDKFGYAPVQINGVNYWLPVYS